MRCCPCDLETIFNDFDLFQLTHDMRQDLLFKAAYEFAKQYGCPLNMKLQMTGPLNR
jgi:hypothetical protein